MRAGSASAPPPQGAGGEAPREHAHGAQGSARLGPQAPSPCWEEGRAQGAPPRGGATRFSGAPLCRVGMCCLQLRKAHARPTRIRPHYQQISHDCWVKALRLCPGHLPRNSAAEGRCQPSAPCCVGRLEPREPGRRRRRPRKEQRHPGESGHVFISPGRPTF